MKNKCDFFKVGDRGQSYEVRALDADGNDMGIGYTDDATGGSLIKMVNAHPSWHSPRVIDRKKSDFIEIDDGCCPKCGCHWMQHNDDGSCVED